MALPKMTLPPISGDTPLKRLQNLVRIVVQAGPAVAEKKADRPNAAEK